MLVSYCEGELHFRKVLLLAPLGGTCVFFPAEQRRKQLVNGLYSYDKKYRFTSCAILFCVVAITHADVACVGAFGFVDSVLLFEEKCVSTFKIHISDCWLTSIFHVLASSLNHDLMTLCRRACVQSDLVCIKYDRNVIYISAA